MAIDPTPKMQYLLNHERSTGFSKWQAQCQSALKPFTVGSVSLKKVAAWMRYFLVLMACTAMTCHQQLASEAPIHESRRHAQDSRRSMIHSTAYTTLTIVWLLTDVCALPSPPPVLSARSPQEDLHPPGCPHGAMAQGVQLEGQLCSDITVFTAAGLYLQLPDCIFSCWTVSSAAGRCSMHPIMHGKLCGVT